MLSPRQLGSILTGVIVGAVLIVVGNFWTPPKECRVQKGIRNLDGSPKEFCFVPSSLSWMPTALIDAGIVVIIAGVLIAFTSTGTRNTDG